MKAKAVEGSWEENWPVNWEFIGMVVIEEGMKPPNFIIIDGVKYEKTSA